MSVILPRLMLVASVLSPSLSWALGLGEIHLQSSLNEPMKAEIDLLAASPDELTALHASLAPREAFTRYGIDRPSFLSSLGFKVAKNKDGRDVLQVTSADAIPEPFVTFLIEVNWARGRLMREYTVLLDPPVYTPGERANSSAPVSAATSTAPAQVPSRSAPVQAPSAGTAVTPNPPRRTSSAAAAGSAGALDATSYRVAPGDTLTKIVRSMRAGSSADVDQTMIAVYRANPDAFGGNINVLKRGAVLRIPGADEVAALNQSEAMNEVHRQMSAWRGGPESEPAGHLRLVTPGAGSGTGNSGGGSDAGATTTAETTALRTRVKDLESQLNESKRLLDVRNNELADLQHKLGSQAGTPAPKPGAATPAPTPAPAAAPPVAVNKPLPAPPAPAVAPTQTAPAATTLPEATPPAAGNVAPSAASAVEPPAPAAKPVAAAAQDSGSWIDWVAANWWLPAAVIVALIAGLAIVAWRKRQAESEFPPYDSVDAGTPAARGGLDDSFVVEESGEHPRLQPEFGAAAEPFADTTSELKAPEDTLSSEGAVNLDQGDPLAEADFHMAYGLYDQAADLVRIALEREPERRDLRMKLLEIYFVWGNKEQFLQSAKALEATRDQAPPGEWDKVLIMGKQIAPEEPMFQATGSGRGAGALVDLNLEGGENRVDIDLFGEPEGDHREGAVVKNEEPVDTGESPRLHAADDLDFTLDAPERGADDAPTREMPRRGDEPTVESELMSFHDAPTQESPTLANPTVRDRFANLTPKTDQTAEVSLDDLGLDLESLETSDTSLSHSNLSATDHAEHPADAPTMVAGLDEKSRALMEEADSHAHDRDLTELERELEASFVADLGPDHDQNRTEILGPDSGPTLQIPRGQDFDTASTSRFSSPEFSDIHEVERSDVDSTSRLRGLDANSIDLDLDRLANQLGQGDTVEQPRSDDEIFSAEVFDATTRSKGVDLDVGDMFDDDAAAQEPTNRLKPINPNATNRIAPEDALPELEPVTMSEVGTKLDLARAYMDMGDPEGARSILEEVVSEGSASQKQEAQRLIEALPG